MTDDDWLAARFEAHRTQLRAVAYRVLGSVSEAEDAVQEAWLRLSRSNTTGVENPGGWFTTIVARVALNMLQSRTARREEPLAIYVPDPVVSVTDGADPEHRALLADSVGLAPPFPSPRSPPSWAVPQAPPGNWPAARAGGYGRPPCRTQTSAASDSSLTPSSPPRALATSRHCWPSSASPSPTGRSSRSTSSPTRPGYGASTCWAVSRGERCLAVPRAPGKSRRR
jgi:hypothetical protein